MTPVGSPSSALPAAQQGKVAVCAHLITTPPHYHTTVYTTIYTTDAWVHAGSRFLSPSPARPADQQGKVDNKKETLNELAVLEGMMNLKF